MHSYSLFTLLYNISNRFLPGYIDQGGAQLFGGGGGMNFMNMTALFGRGGGGGGNGVGGGGNADNTPLRMSNDVAAVSTAGSSIHGSIG